MSKHKGRKEEVVVEEISVTMPTPEETIRVETNAGNSMTYGPNTETVGIESGWQSKDFENRADMVKWFNSVENQGRTLSNLNIIRLEGTYKIVVKVL